MPAENKFIIERRDFHQLFEALKSLGYRVMGPVLRDEAIVYDRLDSPEDLPAGWTDEQEGGTYRLKKRGDDALFGYNLGPQSWKKFLHPPAVKLWESHRRGQSITISTPVETPPRWAFLGVRACELKAIGIQDTVFTAGSHVDPIYQARRQQALIIAVNCGQAAATCFCVSMDADPRAGAGFDLALTEVLENGEHYFLVETGTERGEDVLGRVDHRPADQDRESRADAVVARTAQSMGRKMDTTGIKDLLYNNDGHARWDDVASRCLTCANCTMVCPTCFCTTVEDVTDLQGEHAERWRRWDSCFTMDFSYIHGGRMRSSARSRYRQWMTHKLAYWHDQFDSSGCVGCGRCIAWCPAGIDITEEVRAIRGTEPPGESKGEKGK